jgi:hypothetical protein
LVVIQSSIHDMLNSIDDACRASADPPEACTIPVAELIHTGDLGRPSIHIDSQFLAVSMPLRGPAHIAAIVGCSARTVRRRGLEQGLVEAGPPVYIDFANEDGTTTRFWTSSTSSVSNLSDDDLDTLTAQILETFPNFGRRMIEGHFRHLGHRVPRRRLQDSYARVHGPPLGAFGPRQIQRRVYKVPGPNSLCHHDGQHGTYLYLYYSASYSKLQLNRLDTVENYYTCIH